jgi:Cdc6-like AAA superfamily ATPase
MKESVNALSSVTGTIDPQTTLLEERPTSRYRNGNGTLCGRKVEKLILNTTYQNFLQNERGPAILVRGISGSGKTTLVESLREVISETGGYFCSGKFFQDNDGGEPCECIILSFLDNYSSYYSSLLCIYVYIYLQLMHVTPIPF